KYGVPLSVAAIGAGQAYADDEGRWSLLRGTGEAGALLVRPDNHVAWRCQGVPGDGAAASLEGAFRALLGRG
ncbi:MAG: 2,4-dichlorophenol 6-monooxygenase, partial [Gammaproteobacteria bacterium]